MRRVQPARAFRVKLEDTHKDSAGLARTGPADIQLTQLLILLGGQDFQVSFGQRPA